MDRLAKPGLNREQPQKVPEDRKGNKSNHRVRKRTLRAQGEYSWELGREMDMDQVRRHACVDFTKELAEGKVTPEVQPCVT